MRTAFIQTLTELMRVHDDIMTLTPDMGFSVFEELQKEFPKRFFNTGVTEQSTLGVATALSMSGYSVFIYAQAIFLTLRSFEQVRLDIAYHQSNVKIIGTAAGFWLNQLGISHFALEDVGAMRMLPEMTILSPGDPQEVVWATQKAYELKGPVYLRLGKPDHSVIHTKPVQCDLGDILKILPGTSNLLLVTGGMLPTAVEVAHRLKQRNIPLCVYSVPTLKPLGDKQLTSVLQKYSTVFTLEEHSIIGGLGTLMAEFITDHELNHIRLLRMGTPDTFINVAGSREYLLNRSGLSPEALVSRITSYLR